MAKPTITRERLEQLADNNTICKVSWDERIELAQIALAAMDSEPVAYISKSDFDAGYPHILARRDFNKACTMPVYAAQPAPVVPELRVDWQENEFSAGWNACRAAMLQELKKSAGTKAICRSDENVQVLHTKSPAQGGNSLVIPDEMTSEQAYEIGYYYGDPVDVFARGANWMRQHIIDSTLAAAPQSPGSEPATMPGKWIPVSERMPEDEQEVLTINRMGHRFVSFFDKHSGLFFDRLDAPAACCIEHVLVTHWMPLPAVPQEVNRE